MSRSRRLLAVAVACLLGGELVGLVGYAAGLRVNLSPSLPRGLYRFRATAAERGSLALVCLPEDLAARFHARHYLGGGSCPAGIPPLGKLVAAMGGDLVVVTSKGITVNGRLLETSRALAADASGRRLPTMSLGVYRVAAGSVWLQGLHPRSFDSRYFGFVTDRAIVGSLEPLLLWPGDSASFRMRNRAFRRS